MSELLEKKCIPCSMDVKITHIFHSGFIMETEDIQMVFDYYRGDIALKNKKTIVFVTHGHGDHYTRQIFNWRDNIDDIYYVMSSDIKDAPNSNNIFSIKPYESLDIEDIHIKSFGSTDLGVSLVINYKGKTIFFAGDLNWWHWQDDSVETQKDEEAQFKNEIEKISKGTKDIDIAFFPVDPRLGEGFSFGGEYIIKSLSPVYLIPMHFGDKFDTSEKFIHKIGDTKTDIVNINKPGQVMDLHL